MIREALKARSRQGLLRNEVSIGIMLDIRWICDNPQAFDNSLARRGLKPMAQKLIALDEARRTHMAGLQEAQARRNAASREIGRVKAGGDQTAVRRLIEEVAKLKTFIHEGEEEQRRLDKAFHDRMIAIPNRPCADVPDGADETANVEHHRHDVKPDFTFTPREHFEIGEKLGIMDFATAARMSGSRFVLLKRDLARLERALASFMLDLHTTRFGYEEVAPPMLVRDEAMYGTAQLPKFADDQFRVGDHLWLIPTSEVPLTNIVREHILEEAELPLRFTAFTPCFRKESGAAGRDTSGMIRMHQFSKVELVSITTPENSSLELERMLACAEEVLKQLELHYRVLALCAGDLGFSSRRTLDIEVWMPGQGAYREVSSCSLCGDFQARRMNARYRPVDGKATDFIHTLNGTAVAAGRTIAAILENFQNKDGSVAIPPVLKPYMGGQEMIEPQA